MASQLESMEKTINTLDTKAADAKKKEATRKHPIPCFWTPPNHMSPWFIFIFVVPFEETLDDIMDLLKSLDNIQAEVADDVQQNVVMPTEQFATAAKQEQDQVKKKVRGFNFWNQ